MSRKYIVSFKMTRKLAQLRGMEPLTTLQLTEFLGLEKNTSQKVLRFYVKRAGFVYDRGLRVWRRSQSGADLLSLLNKLYDSTRPLGDM